MCLKCSSLALRPQQEQSRIIRLVASAGITVVSLPLVNEWTQVTHPCSSLRSRSVAEMPLPAEMFSAWLDLQMQIDASCCASSRGTGLMGSSGSCIMSGAARSRCPAARPLHVAHAHPHLLCLSDFLSSAKKSKIFWPCRTGTMMRRTRHGGAASLCVPCSPSALSKMECAGLHQLYQSIASTSWSGQIESIFTQSWILNC